MIIVGGGLFGVLLGVMTARKHGGNTKDKAQYAAVYGIIFALLGVVVSVVIERIVA